jgi:DNA-directed RNA polymerase subunit omega
MKVVNADVEPGETKVVNSRYSIVMATAKRARQIVDGDEPLVDNVDVKPLSIAVEELNQGKIKIIADDELEDFENEIREQAAVKAAEIMEQRAEAKRLAEETAEVAEEEPAPKKTRKSKAAAAEEEAEEADEE